MRGRETRAQQQGEARAQQDDALLAWLSSRGNGGKNDATDIVAALGDGQDCPSYGDAKDGAFDALEVAFSGLAGG